MPTYRNDRTGAAVTTDLAPAALAARFAELYGGRDHWLWFHLATAVTRAAGREPKPATAAALRFLQDQFLLAIAYSHTRRAEADAKAAAAGKKPRAKSEMPKSPMIRAHHGDRRFKLYLSKRGTVCLKSGALAAPAADGSRDPVGDEEFVGFFVGGQFRPGKVGPPPDDWRNDRRPVRPPLADERTFLAGLEADPVGFLARCSKDMGRCCYCNQPLETPESKEVGYGPVCAAHWGLPWGDKDRREKVPSFSRVYDDDAAGLLWDIRADPTDPVRWMVFSDWLESHGLPRCSPPPAGAVLPRNDDAPRPVADVAAHLRACDEHIAKTLGEPLTEHGYDDDPDAAVPPVPDPAPAADDRLPWERQSRELNGLPIRTDKANGTTATAAIPARPAPVGIGTAKTLSTALFRYVKGTKLGAGTFSAEASALGWPPGVFPRTFTLRNPKTGNTVTMTRDHDEIEGGEVVAVLYRTDSGLFARVSND